MKLWTEATPLAKLRLIAFVVVGLMAVHAAFLLYSLYRSEALLAHADATTSVIEEEAREASRRPLQWMLGEVPFGFILAALALAQVRRIGERTERVAHMGRRMVEGDVEACPDPADRDELEEVQSALNEMATRNVIQGRRQAAQHAVTRVVSESETLGRAMSAILKAICESVGWFWRPRGGGPTLW